MSGFTPKRNFFSVGTSILILILACASCKNRVLYLDDDLPESVPKKYAEGIINLPNRFQQNMTISPDGSEHYFTETNADEWRYLRILRITNNADKVELDTPRFVKNLHFENEHFIGEPMLSPDNSKLLFVADFPPGLWQAKRSESGDWENPQKLTIGTDKADWYPTVGDDGSIYFTNDTIQKSLPDLDKLVEVKVPAGPFRVVDPYIGPNEDYIIFSQRIDQTSDQTDLFFSVKIADGWSTPVGLGDKINTEHLEFAPYVSPDQKYLFFSRRDHWLNATYSNIYWVKFDLVDR